MSEEELVLVAEYIQNMLNTEGELTSDQGFGNWEDARNYLWSYGVLNRDENQGYVASDWLLQNSHIVPKKNESGRKLVFSLPVKAKGSTDIEIGDNGTLNFSLYSKRIL
jgi:hypothetical protein